MKSSHRLFAARVARISRIVSTDFCRFRDPRRIVGFLSLVDQWTGGEQDQVTAFVGFCLDLPEPIPPLVTDQSHRRLRFTLAAAVMHEFVYVWIGVGSQRERFQSDDARRHRLLAVQLLLQISTSGPVLRIGTKATR